MDAISSTSTAAPASRVHHHRGAGKAAASTPGDVPGAAAATGGSGAAGSFTSELQSILLGAQTTDSPAQGSATQGADTASQLQSLLGGSDEANGTQSTLDAPGVLDRLQRSLQQRLTAYTQAASPPDAGITA